MIIPLTEEHHPSQIQSVMDLMEKFKMNDMRLSSKMLQYPLVAKRWIFFQLTMLGITVLEIKNGQTQTPNLLNTQ